MIVAQRMTVTEEHEVEGPTLVGLLTWLARRGWRPVSMKYSDPDGGMTGDYQFRHTSKRFIYFVGDENGDEVKVIAENVERIAEAEGKRPTEMAAIILGDLRRWEATVTL